MSGIVEYALPRGWCWATIEALAEYVQRGKSPKYAERSSLPVVNQRCVRWDGVQVEHLKFVDPAQWGAWAPERSLRDGDILWNSTGTGTIGRAAIYRPIEGYPRVVADSHVTIVRMRIGLPEYVHAWIRSPAVQGRIDAMQTGSTNQVELGRAEVLRTRVPVAPLNEQRRIVAKLEGLQGRSRRAREALDAVPPLLENLRQSVLAAAFRGDLTKEWRAKNRDVEPASKLVERIRAERRRTWEQSELAKMKAKGKAPTDDKWKSKYREPEPVDAAGLPDLPHGWIWVSVETAGDVLLGRRRAAEEYVEGKDGRVMRPYVRVANVKEDRLVLADVLEMPFNEGELALYRLLPGDIILSEGQSPELVGQSAVFEGGFDDLCIQATVHRFRAYESGTSSAFSQLVFLHHLHAGVFMRASSLTTNIAHLTSERLKPLPFPLPPKAEQMEIVRRVREVLGRTKRLEATANALRGRERSLSASVLAKAFRGELVSQDPKDETADAMLARGDGDRSDVSPTARLAAKRHAEGRRKGKKAGPADQEQDVQ